MKQRNDANGKRCVVNGKKGVVIETYFNAYWHPYLYKGFKVQFDNGEIGTVMAKNTKFE